MGSTEIAALVERFKNSRLGTPKGTEERAEIIRALMVGTPARIAHNVALFTHYLGDDTMLGFFTRILQSEAERSEV